MSDRIPDLFPVPGSLLSWTDEPPTNHTGDNGKVSQISKINDFIQRQLRRAVDAGRPWQCFVKAAGMMDVNDPTGRLPQMTVADGSWVICVWIGRPFGVRANAINQSAATPQRRASMQDLFPIAEEREPAFKDDAKPDSFKTEIDEVCDFIRRQILRADKDTRRWQAHVTPAGLPVGHGLRDIQPCDSWLIYVYIGKPQFTKSYLLPVL